MWHWLRGLRRVAGAAAVVLGSVVPSWADNVVWTISDIAGFAQTIAVTPNGQYIYYGCPEYDPIINHSNIGLVAIGTPSGGLGGIINYPGPVPPYGAQFGLAMTASNEYVAIYGGGQVFVMPVPTGAAVAQYSKSLVYGKDIASTSQSLFIGDWAHSVGSLSGVGRIRVYPWGPTTSPVTISHPEPESGAWFGISMAVNGSLLAVAAPNQGGSGKVYLFDLLTLSLVRSLSNPIPSGSTLGWRMVLTPNILFVSALGNGGSVPSQGYLFDVATGDLITTLSKQHSYDFSGGDVVVINGYLAWGNPVLPGQTGAPDAGGYHVYNVTSGQYLWTTRNPVIPGTEEFWGERMALIGPDLLVGEYAFGGSDDRVMRMQLIPPFPASVAEWMMHE